MLQSHVSSKIMLYNQLRMNSSNKIKKNKMILLFKKWLQMTEKPGKLKDKDKNKKLNLTK